MRFYFARSSRRHKIGRAHALAALANAGAPTVVTDAQGDTKLHWVAKDDRGIELHMAGRPSVEDPTGLVIIIHIQPTSQRSYP